MPLSTKTRLLARLTGALVVGAAVLAPQAASAGQTLTIAPGQSWAGVLASAQPGDTSVSSLSSWTTSPRAAATPALAAAAKPRCRGRRSNSTPANCRATRLHASPAEASSTTRACEPAGRCRHTERRHAANRSGRLCDGMTIDSVRVKEGLLLADDAAQVRPRRGRRAGL